MNKKQKTLTSRVTPLLWRGAGGEVLITLAFLFLSHFSYAQCTVYAVSSTGNTALCAGAAGPTVTLGNSVTGVSYQLKRGSTNVGSAKAGATGTALSWANNTTAGTYTVVATKSTAPTCSATMSGSVVVTVNALPATPTASNITKCGTSDVVLTATSTSTGIFNLYATSTGGSPLQSSTTSATSYSFTLLAVSATTTYYVAVNNGTCESARRAIVVTINPVPAAPTTTSASRCGTGAVTLTASSVVAGIFKLYNASGGLVNTSTSTTAYSYATPSLTATTNYSISFTTAAGCVSATRTPATATVNPAPLIYTVTGGATCSPGIVTVGLSSSKTGTSYQLKLNGTDVGAAKTGTNAVLSWGAQGAAGTYTIVATIGSLCPLTMTGSAVVNALPNASYSLSGGAALCPGATTTISLGGSEANVNYQLKVDGSAAGSALPGTGTALNWPGLSTLGVYSVTATTVAGCASSLPSTASVSSSPLPMLFQVGGGGIYKGTDLPITLSGSETGTAYQLQLATANVDAPKTGTGGALDMPAQKTAGTYSVMATSANGCVQAMGGSASISTDPTWAAMDMWAFQYKYDGRRRMTHKKVPGADWVYMVYDDRDRLVLTQDGNQRKTNQWTFTKYDALNRPVMTGLFTDADHIGWQNMQDEVTRFYAAGGAWFETFTTATGNIHGYDNQSFPSEPQWRWWTTDYLTVTYYDDYGFKALFNDSDNDYKPNVLAPVTSLTGTYGQEPVENTRVKGQVTGGKVKVLGEGNYLLNVTYYDDKYRVIQAVADNTLGGKDRQTNIVDFVGKVLATETEQSVTHLDWNGPTYYSYTGKSVEGGGGEFTHSVQKLAANTDGWIEFTQKGINNDKFFMLGGNGIRLSQNGYYIYENNIHHNEGGYGAVGQVYRIERKAGIISFYAGGAKVWTCQGISTSELAVDVMLNRYQPGSCSVDDIRTSFSRQSTSTARTFEYDHAGRLMKTWHQVGNPSATIHWKDLVGVTASGNTLTKSAGNFAWDAGAASVETLPANTDGWAEFTVTSLAAYHQMLGFSATNTDADYTSINYALYQAEGQFAIFENGNNVGPVVGLAVGSIMRVECKGTAINYYLNGNLMYTSPTPSTSSLLLDVSMAVVGGTLQNIRTSFVAPSPPVLLTKNDYNELGQLVTKNLHNDDPATANDNTKFKQNVDYRYNIRGWLTKINDAAAPTTNDLFGMELNYNTPSANGGPAQFNGNISETIWRGGDGKVNSYGYNYDAMNRLTAASYFDRANATKNGRFNESITGYDLNGNILGLSRNGKTGTLASGSTDYGLMDYLDYSVYKGNQLYKVDDSASKTEGFKEGTSTGNDYAYDANGNMVKDLNKDITLPSPSGGGQVGAEGADAIQYNHLNLPAKVNKANGDYVQYTYDATGRKLRQQVYKTAQPAPHKTTDYAGEFYYENDTLKFINHEEGRVVIASDSEAIYQYHLKDHLGNVRTTFTTKKEQEETTATYEQAAYPTERSQYLRFENAKLINSVLFNHTPSSPLSSGEGSGVRYSQRLNGTANEKMGLAKSLSVMPGDTITMEAYAKYLDPNTNNWTAALSGLVQAIASGSGAGTSFIDGPSYSTASADATPPWIGGNGRTTSHDGAPLASMNYVFIGRDFDPLSLEKNFTPITTEAMEDGTNRPHQKLTITYVAKTAGYMYIYLANDSETANPKDVFFDDFTVTQTKSPVVQADDYYPFGLTFNSYSRENSVPNRWKFQGQEHVDDLDLNWDSFKWRNHQPDIGRFFNVDPLADKYVYNSPYAFSENHVTSHVELEGLEKFSINPIFRDALMSDQVQSSVRSANQSGANMIRMDGGVQGAGFGFGGQAGGFKAGGSLQIATANGGVTSSGEVHAEGSLISAQGGLSTPGGYGANGNVNIGNADVTYSQGNLDGNTSLISANGNANIPNLTGGSDAPMANMSLPSSISQKVASDNAGGSQSISANTSGVIGVKVVLGNVWTEVRADAGAAMGFIKNIVNALGSFIGQSATNAQNPQQTSAVPKEVREQN